MSNEYKKLREEMDSAELDSILPGFDREASWNQLSPRLKKINNKMFLWRYAALVVMAIAAMLVRMQMNKENRDEQVATSIAPIKTPAADTPVAPAAPNQELVLTPVETVVARKRTAPKAAPQAEIRKETPPQPREELIANTQEQPEEHKILQPVEQTLVTQAKPAIKCPKAVHLLDIDNENRQAVIQNRKELQGFPLRIVNLIPGRPYSNTENDRKPSSLFRTN